MKLLSLLFILLLYGCADSKGPVELLQDELSRVDARLHGFIGQRREVVVEAIGPPDKETQTEMIYELGEYLATIDVDQDIVKKYHLERYFNEK